MIDVCVWRCRYEGVALLELAEWLRRGDMEREAQLLRVLDSVPLPKKLTQGACTCMVGGLPACLPRGAARSVKRACA
jgi:hypothetical protein